MTSTSFPAARGKGTFGERKLIANAIQTPDGTVLRSYAKGTTVMHMDANGHGYIIGGGLGQAVRLSQVTEDCVELSLYDDEPHEVQRKVMVWGTHGLSGHDPLKYVQISEMSNRHIQAVLRECVPQEATMRCMENELAHRGVTPSHRHSPAKAMTATEARARVSYWSFSGGDSWASPKEKPSAETAAMIKRMMDGTAEKTWVNPSPQPKPRSWDHSGRLDKPPTRGKVRK